MAEDNNNVTITIDGREVTVPRGTTVLQAAKQLGIDIPTFCWHPKLKPAGACRICYVEIEKIPKLMVSCATPATPGMVVYTNTDKVRQGRRAVLEFTLANHPLDCPTCDKGGECDLQDLTFRHGVDDSRFDFNKYRFIRDKNSTFDDLRIGPEIIRNQNRCILCYKCIRANKEIFGEVDLGAFQRGNITEISPPPGREVNSIFSGNLVEICPVGALTNTDWRYKIRVWKTQTVPSVCTYCADGCNITLWKNRQRVYRATSRRNDDIDEGWLCDVGRYGYQLANAEGRLTTPLIKKGDNQVAATWEEAIELIARRFKDIKDNKGGVCLGGIISPNLDCNSMYLFSKFFRSVLNSNNVDFRADYKMLPEKPGDIYTSLSFLKFSIADIEKSDVIMVIDSDPVKEHPIVNLRLRKAAVHKHAALYHLNPIATKSGEMSTDEMVYNIGTLDALLNGMAISVIEQGLAVEGSNTAGFKDRIKPDSVDEAARISGIEAERIRAAAKALAEAKRPTIIGGEMLTSSVAREKLARAIYNLVILTGLLKKGQLGLLSRAANSKGAEKLGVMPHLDKDSIGALKGLWGVYPELDGLASDRMIRAAIKEELDTLLLIGADLMPGYPDGQFVKEGLGKLDFLVVADLFETPTTQIADVVLPLSSWTEYDGRFVNLEGRSQVFKAAIRPAGQSKPAYEIMNLLAGAFKAPLYESLAEVEKDVSRLLDRKIKTELEDELQEVIFVEEKVNPDFIVPIIITDELHHYGHWTEKTGSLSAFCGEAFLEVAPAVAEKMELKSGTIVRVESEVGKINLPVKISEFIDNDVVRAYRNFATNPVNVLQMRKKRVDRVRLTRVEGT